jgi:hypothetical protein
MYVPPGKRASTASFTRNHLMPSSTQEATKHTIEILDANFKTANLPEIIKKTCKYLPSVEQSKLLGLVTKYEELFDKTLGEFQTYSVRFDL